MEVKILSKRPGNNFCKYEVDIKVIYPGDKWEIFRNVKYIEKDKKHFINFPSTKVNEKWELIYERSTPLDDIKTKLAEMLKES